MTNGERIRSMTDEELTEFLNEVSGCNYCPINKLCIELNRKSQTIIQCPSVWKKWLKSEVEE